MLIVRDSQVKKLFYKEQEIDKILDWNGNVVFKKESAPVMTNTIKFHTTSAVTSSQNFTVTYTDSTQDTVSYSEPSKEYSLSIPTDKIVNKINFDNTMVDEVKVSCKIKLSSGFFYKRPKTIRLLSCDATSSTDLASTFTGNGFDLFEIRNLDARNATSMDSFLWRNIELRTIIMRDINVSNVTTIESIFEDSYSATTIDVANWNTSSVTEFSSAFASCKSVTSLDLSSWDVSKAIFMNYMFYESNNLVSLDISGWDMTNVRGTSIMFYNCKSLKTVYMRGCNQTTIDKIKRVLPSGATIIT